MMKILMSRIAFVAMSTSMAIAGGNSFELTPIEPTMNVPQKEVVIVNNNVKYDGFYLGGALSYLRMNAIDELRGHALTLIGGYYFNKYIGLEAHYTSTLTDLDLDSGASVTSSTDTLTNLGIYLKPMYNLTTGFSVYGLAGYGRAKSADLEESGLQWGIGSKYELANGVGLFLDYMNLYNGDNFDTIQAQGAFFNSTSVGATFTF